MRVGGTPRRALLVVLPLLAVLATTAASDRALTEPGNAVPVPLGLPVPAVPADNPFTPAKAELGRHLFYDTRLSATGTTACASCHQQALAFTDGKARAIGATGENHRRSAMSLANVAYNRTFNWAEARTRSLEEQALVPMFGLAPIERGITGHEKTVLRSVASEPVYQRLFPLAFPQTTDPINFENIVRAIASFERTLNSVGSPYDRYTRHGELDALEPAAQRGLELFFSPRLGCAGCHAGFNLAGNTTWFGRAESPLEFHNTGLYNLGRGRYPADDNGRFEETGRKRDRGSFRAPTLRNIAVTAPYMHDGSVATLDEVLDHYAAGGRTLHHGSNAGVGRRNRYKSREIRPVALSKTQRSDLLTFFDSLTDEAFLTNPALGDPWHGVSGDPFAGL